MMNRILPWLSRAAVILVLAGTAWAVVWFLRQDVSKSLRKYPESAMELNNAHLRVFRNGRLQWEGRSKLVQVAPDEVQYSLVGINHGMLYRKSKPPFAFSAGGATYNTVSKEVNVTGPVKFVSSNGDYVSTGNVAWNGTIELLSTQQPVRLSLDGNIFSAGMLRAQGASQESVFMQGDVRVYLPDVEKSGGEKAKADLKESKVKKEYLKRLHVDADIMEYQRIRKTIHCFVNRAAPFATGAAKVPDRYVTATTQNFKVKSFDMMVDDSAKFVHAIGNVQVWKRHEKPSPKRSNLIKALQKQDTMLKAQDAFYYWKDGRLVIPGYMEVTQPHLNGSAFSATLDNKAERLTLTGAVILRQTSGEWLMKEKVIDEDVGDRVKKSLKNEAVVNCSSLEVDFNTENVVAYGNVLLKQKDQLLQAETAAYDSKSRTWHLSGAPQASDKDGAVIASRFDYNTKTRWFEANGNAISEFKPDKDNRDDVEKFFKDRDGSTPKDSFEKERVNVSADHIQNNDKKKLLIATGAARVAYRDVMMYGDKIYVNYDTKQANARGHIIIVDKYTMISGAKARLNWDTGDARIDDDVFIDYQGKPASGDKKARDPFSMKCDWFEYNWKTKKGRTDQNPDIESRGRRIRSRTLAMDLEANIFEFNDDVRMHQDNGDWLRDKDYIDTDDEKTWRIAEKPTDVRCDSARFESDHDYFLLKGNVKVDQKEKHFSADTMEFNGKDKRLWARGNVRMFQDNGEWLFTDNMFDEDTDEDVKDRARGKVEVTAKYFESRYGEREMYLEDDVKIDQDKSRGSCDKLWYYGKDKKVIMEGNVDAVNDDGRTIKAQRAIYDDKAHTLEAFYSIRGKGRVEQKQ